jgi:hypothetical protein
LLLSTAAYKYNHKPGKPFQIGSPPEHISDQEVFDCLKSLINLFNDYEKIEINADNLSKT